MGAKNKVIAGDYINSSVLAAFGTLQLVLGFFDSIVLDKSNVESYELITDEHRKSAMSGASRGIVGGLLLGPAGMLAGSLSAKSKGIYHVAIQFKDGKKSLLEVDDKVYRQMVKSFFDI